MSDTFITIMAIMLVVVLMFVIPFMATANQNDRITQSSVQTILDNFTNTVSREGKITESTYRDLVDELEATGNTYSVALEVRRMSDNPGAKGDKKDVIGENIYYSEYTADVVRSLSDPSNGYTYELNKGDKVITSVKNTNITTGTQLKNFFYSLMGKDTIAIEASSTALIAK